MKLLEYALPNIFQYAAAVLKGDDIAKISHGSSTVNITKMTDVTADFLRRYSLKFESDYYEFAKSIFYRQIDGFKVS